MRGGLGRPYHSVGCWVTEGESEELGGHGVHGWETLNVIITATSQGGGNWLHMKGFSRVSSWGLGESRVTDCPRYLKCLSFRGIWGPTEGGGGQEVLASEGMSHF